MFTVYIYKPVDESEWVHFVTHSNNGTIFHLRSFLKYHPQDRFNDHSLIIKKKGKFFEYALTL